MTDIIGQALIDYQSGNYTEDIYTETSISERDILPLPYLFRSFEEMPQLEKEALRMAKGHVLDVGCGAGSHALYLQNTKQLDVVAIDISEGAIEVCKHRGVKKASLQNILQVKGDRFDTILMLMNGTGIIGTLKKIPAFLEHLKGILNTKGQILVDSSDLIYMFEKEDDGSISVPAINNYYGELDFRMSYKGNKSESFPWLFLDFNTLNEFAASSGFHCELIKEAAHYDYLARLSVKDSF